MKTKINLPGFIGDMNLNPSFFSITEKNKKSNGLSLVIPQMKPSMFDSVYVNRCSNSCNRIYWACKIGCTNILSEAGLLQCLLGCEIANTQCQSTCPAGGLFGNWGYLP